MKLLVRTQTQYRIRLNLLKMLVVTASTFLPVVLAHAEGEQPKGPKPVFGIVKDSYASIGSITESICYVSSTKSLPEGQSIVIIGSSICKRSYSGDKKFYQIAEKGKIYSISADNVNVVEEDLKRLENMTDKEAEDYRKEAITATRALWLREVNKAMGQLDKAKKFGITILKSRIYDVSEYTEGTGFEVTYYNPTKKTIKYITTNLVGYNAVGDPVKIKGGKTQATVKGIGPIEPGSSASYSYDYAWFTDLVEKYKIVSIKVQYMDGTNTTVKEPKKAWLDKQSYDILTEFNNESSDSEEAAAPAAPAAEAAAPAAEAKPARKRY